MIDEIMKRIDEFGLSIDSLYIQSNDSLNVIINSDKLHELRSCSKLLVAMAMGIAIENNLFSLEESIYNYIEESKIPDFTKNAGGHKDRGGGKIFTTDPETCHKWVLDIISCADFYNQP